VREVFQEEEVIFPVDDLKAKKQSLGEEKLVTVFKLIALRILDSFWIEQIEKWNF